MKIDNSVSSTGGVFPATPRPASGTAQRAPASSEKVALSPLSTRLQEIAANVQVPDVNASRVSEIKQAIAEGRFQVNPERIADSLISDVRRMLAGQ
jgi:negative regulator of flagellin synthesis FlgM